jgi:hypothetical protein
MCESRQYVVATQAVPASADSGEETLRSVTPSPVLAWRIAIFKQIAGLYE